MRLRPATPLGDDEAPRRFPVTMGSDGILVWSNEALDPEPLQEEFVFRALWDLEPLPQRWTDLAPRNVNELLAFMTKHGALWRHHPRTLAALGATPGDRRAPLDRRVAPPRQDQGQFAINHLADAVEWLRDLKRCAEHIAALQRGQSPAPIWDLDESIQRARSRGDEADPDDWAHAQFCKCLNEGLSQYKAGVEYPMTYMEGQWGQNVLDLYGAGCVMLHDILLERVELKFCKREKCQRPFLRAQPKEGQEADRKKRGRSEGALYCNPGCKDAQTQMDKSRRRAEERARTEAQVEGEQ